MKQSDIARALERLAKAAEDIARKLPETPQRYGTKEAPCCGDCFHFPCAANSRVMSPVPITTRAPRCFKPK